MLLNSELKEVRYEKKEKHQIENFVAGSFHIICQ